MSGAKTKMKDEFQDWSDIIMNLPVSCNYCGKDIPKGTEVRFEINAGRHEPFCNLEHAIAHAEYLQFLYLEYSKNMKLKVTELLKLRVK